MQKTKYVDYNLVEQRSIRANTEETKHYLMQEEFRSYKERRKTAVIRRLQDRSKRKVAIDLCS